MKYIVSQRLIRVEEDIIAQYVTFSFMLLHYPHSIESIDTCCVLKFQLVSYTVWILSKLDTYLYVFVPLTAGSRSSSPGKLLGHSSYGRIPRATASASTTPADKRSRIPRSQGCSRETSPSRLGLGKARTPAHNSHKSICCSAGLFGWYESGIVIYLKAFISHSLLLHFFNVSLLVQAL